MECGGGEQTWRGGAWNGVDGLGKGVQNGDSVESIVRLL